MRWVALAMVLGVCACGDDAATQDAGLDGAVDSTVSDDAALFPDVTAPIPDVTPAPRDVGLDDGGGPFLCGGCTCDGRTHYCDISSGPGAPLSSDAGDDADACVAGFGACTPLPDGCVPANCGCLVQSWCPCYHSPDGDGLLAGCVYP